MSNAINCLTTGKRRDPSWRSEEEKYEKNYCAANDGNISCRTAQIICG